MLVIKYIFSNQDSVATVPSPTSKENYKYLIALVVGIGVIVILIILGFILSRKYNQVK